MNELELKSKLSQYKLDIRGMIEKYVIENAEYKIGDIVQSCISSENSFFVIIQIGYNCVSEKIIYYGKKVRKVDGVITYFDMNCFIGTNEECLAKATLKLKNGLEISHIDEHLLFKKDIEIKINV